MIDPGAENYEHALELATEAKARSPIARRGTAAFDGADDRVGAAEAYRRILGESGVQIRGRQGGVALRGHPAGGQHSLQQLYEEAEDNFARHQAAVSQQEPPPAPGEKGEKAPSEAVGERGPPETPIAALKERKGPKPPARPISRATKRKLGPRPDDPIQGQLWDRAAARLDSQVEGAIPLEPGRKESGEFKFTKTGDKDNPKYDPVYEKIDYGLANAPMLKKQGKALGTEINPKTGKQGMAKAPKEVEDDIAELDPENRLMPFLTPTDRKRLAHLNDMSAVDAYADKLHEMYKGIEHLPEVMEGKNWYEEAEQLLRKHFGKHADLVANLLGATSAGNQVKINYNMAMEAYHQFLRGHYDDAIDLYRKAYAIRDSGKGALIQHILDNKIHEALGEDAPGTDEAAMEQYIAHHGITPKSSLGKLFGHNSLHVLKVLAHTWEEEAGGPKTPNFAGNLSGRSLQATIDMWAARTMRRLGYEGHQKQPWLIQPAGETGVNDVDFGLGQLAFRKAAERIGIKPSSLQAILWFAEQKHWQKQGWEREQDPAERDYRPMLRAYARPEDIPAHAYERELHAGPPEAPGEKAA